VLTAAVITFATGLINLLRSDKINKHIEGGNAGTTLNIVPPRYVPEKKGSQDRDDLVQAFSSQPHQEYFHKISSLSAESIAARYGIPQTDRSIECNLNGTTQVGWIPKANSIDGSFEKVLSQQLIPRIIFQSWKTNHLTYNLCQTVLSWAKLNPEYDYLLFDDDAADLFVQKEFGDNIFHAFSCVKVGAAKCDVWRLMVVYIYGGIYFDIDVKANSAFSSWGFGNRTVVTGRGCNNKRHPTGCAHQWGLIYSPFHPVLQNAIKETLQNLATMDADHVYGVSFWAFYNAWVKGPYNSSYMPGWGDNMGGRVIFFEKETKIEMVSANGHWPDANGKNKIWKPECL
jgi:hypothetical protein